MLLSAANAVESKGYQPHALGLDLNRHAAIAATAILFVNGKDADIRIADSLTTDPFPDVQADLALSQPPLGLNWHSQESVVRERHLRDGWYRLGLPQRSDSTWLFASRLLEKLKSPEAGGGRAIVLAAPGALRQSGGSEIRRTVLEGDLLEAVVGLPSGIAPGIGVPLYALIFTNIKASNYRSQVQVIDLRAYFETSRHRGVTSRDMREDAVDVLTRSLASTKSDLTSRIVPADYFLRHVVNVRPHRTGSTSAESALNWDVEVPASRQLDPLLRDRYGGSAVYTWRPTDKVQARLEIDTIFDATESQFRRWLHDQRWQGTRLSMLVAEPPRLLIEGDSLSPGTRACVLLPTGSGNAATSPEGLEGGGRVLLLYPVADVVSTNFLAAWLNSSLGRQVRRRALDAAASGDIVRAVRTEPHALMRFLDEILVPLPPLIRQEALGVADGRLEAAGRIAERARRELWERPGLDKRIVARFAPLFEESLKKWGDDLPYPVASALWTLESKRLNVDAAHKQMFLVWEAYAAFTATVLLSALAQDSALRHDELPKLRDALSTAHLSMERATLGSWSAIVQRLSSCFRKLLASEDSDELARVLQLFGSPTFDTLQNLISRDVVRLIEDANAKRNLWEGHPGAASEPELQEHLRYLDDRLEELRGDVGPAWRELRLVRAGDGSLRSGQINQKVELAVGPNAYFQQAEMRVGQLMEKGELYVASDGAARPLRLEHFFVLMASPDKARYSWYFYNRLEGQNVRLVSYHLADQSEITGHLKDVILALKGLLFE
jgi:hypothetical protein